MKKCLEVEIITRMGNSGNSWKFLENHSCEVTKRSVPGVLWQTGVGEAERLVLTTWMIVSLIVGVVYKSNLQAMLIVPRVSYHHTSLFGQEFIFLKTEIKILQEHNSRLLKENSDNRKYFAGEDPLREPGGVGGAERHSLDLP